MSVFFLFLLALTAGTCSTLFWIPEDDLGRGYFQMNALVVLGLLALAAGVFVLHPFAPFATRPGLGTGAFWTAVAAAGLYYAGVWTQRWRAARGAAAVTTLACSVALLLAGSELIVPLTPLPHRGPLLAASLVAGGLLLGWALVTMLLGHWYLVAPKLAFRHLVVFCWTLLAVIALRCVTVAVTLAAAAAVEPAVEPHPWRILTGFQGEGMFLWFRLLWGLAIPLGLGLMSLHCARRRSNQSATGILYVLVVGALIGEVTGLYLTVATGVPV